MNKVHPIARLASDSKITIADIARASGVHPVVLYQVCTGVRHRVGTDSIFKLVKAYPKALDAAELAGWRWPKLRRPKPFIRGRR